jgi:hypothetical protein
MTPLALCAVLGAASWPVPDPAPLSPADAVRVAAADLRRVAAADPRKAFATRYLSAHALPNGERAELYSVISYHVNGISREATLVRPRKVTDWLWAVDIRDYGWTRETFGAVASGGNVDPYFHVRALGADGKAVDVSAPWLPPDDLGYLLQTTGSNSPVLRADWFLYRTAVQEGRRDAGYFDFLRLKSRADAEKLAGLDRKAAESIFREQAAVIQDSGVALQGRQLFRYSTISGNWWETRDTKADESTRDDRNPVRRLLTDYKHDAEEIVFTLPNRLPGFYLSDSKGVQVNSAPPDIASDSKSASNDRRVHASLSCVRCHTRGGLIPFGDLFRGRFDGTLRAADDKVERRLRSVYLGPIQRAFDRDAEDYAAVLADACGLTPTGLSAAFGRQWSRYADEPVDAARAAAETGFTEEEFLRRVRAFAKAETRRVGVADLVLLVLLVGPEPRSLRREQFEELYPLLMTALAEGKP